MCPLMVETYCHCCKASPSSVHTSFYSTTVAPICTACAGCKTRTTCGRCTSPHPSTNQPRISVPLCACALESTWCSTIHLWCTTSPPIRQSDMHSTRTVPSTEWCSKQRGRPPRRTGKVCKWYLRSFLCPTPSGSLGYSRVAPSHCVDVDQFTSECTAIKVAIKVRKEDYKILDE